MAIKTDKNPNGAGRPKGMVENHTLIARKMRAELVKTVRKEFRPIIKAQIDAAKGLYVQKQVKLPNGKTIEKYYLQEPNIPAAKNLIDQAIGKPQESLKVEGEMKTIVDIVSELNDEDKK